jgi:hypothetical protein
LCLAARQDVTVFAFERLSLADGDPIAMLLKKW